MIADTYILVSPGPGRLGQLFNAMVTVRPVGMDMQIAADILFLNQIGNCKFPGKQFLFADILPQFGGYIREA